MLYCQTRQGNNVTLLQQCEKLTLVVLDIVDQCKGLIQYGDLQSHKYRRYETFGINEQANKV